MDTDAYNAHRRVIKTLKEKYKNKGKYPEGINSINADILDREEYLDSLHYVAVYHLLESKNSGKESKTKRIKKRIKQIERCLEEHFEDIGLSIEEHGFEHITDDKSC